MIDLSITFNLDNFPIELLDKYYLRYEPYNLGITYRHPLRCISGINNFKQDIDEIKRIIISTYPLNEKQFLCYKEKDISYLYILIPFIENNIEIIEKVMNKFGYLRVWINDEYIFHDIKGREWLYICFKFNHL